MAQGLLLHLPQAGEEFDIVHDLNGVPATVGDHGLVIEVPVARAKNVDSANDGGSNDMIVIRVVRHYRNEMLLRRLDARGGGLQGSYDTLDLPIIESMHAPQARVAKDAR
jgi:hypothetical protein